jgi:glycosyltransferase involved in cell wall biosynthesis
MANNLLLIAYFFPPDGGAGSQRPTKFARYLPDFGWDLTVLTRTPPSQRGKWDPQDESLVKDIDPRVRVERVAEPERGSGWAMERPVIDRLQAWIGPAFDAAARIVRERAIDAVVVTMSPFSLSRLGLRIQRELRVPVIMDFRDPWALDGWQPHRTKLHWRRQLGAMREAVESAAGVVANTPEASKAFRRVFTKLRSERLAVIPNGYDAADFVERPGARPAAGASASMTIVHTGSLHSATLFPTPSIKQFIRDLLSYAPEKVLSSGRTPLHLLGAIRRLRERGVTAGRKVRLRLVGTIDDATRRVVDESGVSDAVELVGYVPHAASVRALLEADVVFLPLHGLPPGQRSLIVPGKAYEYLAAARPILGCLPPGDARDMIDRCGYGYTADPVNEAQIGERIGVMYDDWKGGKFREIEVPSWVNDYERRELSRRLSEFISKIVGAGAIG